MKAKRGFTLLEVLVALAVIALALGSIIKVVGSGAANAAYLRDKTFAHWVAANQLALMETKENLWPSKGKNDGKAEMAGREWFWTTQVADTPDSDMRRIEISVRLDDDEDIPPVTLLTGFIAKPAIGASLAGAGLD
jgi:general secretion pathway protein I